MAFRFSSSHIQMIHFHVIHGFLLLGRIGDYAEILLKLLIGGETG
jgi:hypothetical protein